MQLTSVPSARSPTVLLSTYLFVIIPVHTAVNFDSRDSNFRTQAKHYHLNPAL